MNNLRPLLLYDNGGLILYMLINKNNINLFY